jgi:mRNA-degrading endonuclease RelE of RelBE toxin-antitoxin system
MAYRIIFHPEADTEYIKSYREYEDKLEGLGSRFESEVDTLISKIVAHPQVYSYGHKPYREACVKDFPYVVVYKVNQRKKQVYVVAVFCTHRNPDQKYRK